MGDVRGSTCGPGGVGAGKNHGDLGLYRSTRAVLSNRQFTPDLIIAEMGVLEFGGVELLKQCNPRGIPVVIFSGSANPDHEAEVLSLGAKQFVRKPIELNEYANAVRKMIADWAVRSSASTAARIVGA